MVRLAGVLHRQHGRPPVHYAIGLRKKPVTADVNAVSLVGNRPRYAAHIGALFEHHGLNTSPPQKLERSRQTGRSRSNDYGGSSRGFSHRWNSTRSTVPQANRTLKL